MGLLLGKIQHESWNLLNNPRTSGRRQSLWWCLPATIIGHNFGRKEFLKKVCHRYGPKTELKQCSYYWFLFYLDFFSCFFIHFCRAFSYSTKMPFHHQFNAFS